MEKIDIAFIGGSGLYKIPNFKKKKWVQIFLVLEGLRLSYV